MLFNSARFFLFLIAVLLLFYASPTRWRKLILLAASYFFYMSWIPKYGLVLLALTAIDYTAALWIAKTSSPGRRKGLLTLSLSSHRGWLGFFKYYNFIAANLALLLRQPEFGHAFQIMLPLGISFHTFQSMS